MFHHLNRRYDAPHWSLSSTASLHSSKWCTERRIPVFGVCRVLACGYTLDVVGRVTEKSGYPYETFVAQTAVVLERNRICKCRVKVRVAYRYVQRVGKARGGVEVAAVRARYAARIRGLQLVVIPEFVHEYQRRIHREIIPVDYYVCL